MVREVGLCTHVEECTVDRAMGIGSSLAREKASKWVWWWELCGWEHGHVLRVKGEEGVKGGLRREERLETTIQEKERVRT